MPNIFYWNNRAIRVNEGIVISDALVNLTDLVHATNQNAEKFLNKKRTLEIIYCFYKEQKGQIDHPMIEIDGEIWIKWFLACEFSYQHPDKKFTLWFNRVLWGDFSHPEIKSDFEQEILDHARLQQTIQLVKDANKPLFE